MHFETIPSGFILAPLPRVDLLREHSAVLPVPQQSATDAQPQAQCFRWIKRARTDISKPSISRAGAVATAALASICFNSPVDVSSGAFRWSRGSNGAALEDNTRLAFGGFVDGNQTLYRDDGTLAELRRQAVEGANLTAAFNDAAVLWAKSFGGLPIPHVWNDEESEVVLEWTINDKHAAITFEGDGLFGCTMLKGDRFVSSKSDGRVASGFPADLAEYLLA